MLGDGASCGHGRGGARGRGKQNDQGRGRSQPETKIASFRQFLVSAVQWYVLNPCSAPACIFGPTPDSAQLELEWPACEIMDVLKH